MGEVIPLKRQRNKFIRSHARETLSTAMGMVGDPIGVVIVTVGRDGSHTGVAVSEANSISDMDLFIRASAVLERKKMDIMAPDE